MNGVPEERSAGLADHVDDVLVRVENWAASVRPLVGWSAVLVIGLAVGWWGWRGVTTPPPVDDLIPQAQPTPPSTSTTPIVDVEAAAGAGPEGPTVAGSGGDGSTGEQLVVHVVGEVRRPGLVTVADGARVSDVVEAAGGPTGAADVDRLNLASPVVDGMQVRVPGRNEEDVEEAGTDEPLIRWPTGAGPGTGADNGTGGPVDLNRAGPQELETLPGIGPSLASAIIAWRDEHGRFSSIDQLEAVPGIGPAKLAALRDRVTT